MFSDGSTDSETQPVIKAHVICPLCGAIVDNEDRLKNHFGIHNEDEEITLVTLGRLFVLQRRGIDFPCPVGECMYQGPPEMLYTHICGVHRDSLQNIPTTTCQTTPTSLGQRGHLTRGKKRERPISSDSISDPFSDAYVRQSQRSRVASSSSSPLQSIRTTPSPLLSKPSPGVFTRRNRDQTGSSPTPPRSIIPRVRSGEISLNDVAFTQYLSSKIGLIKPTCVAHFALRQQNLDGHESLRECTLVAMHRDSHYESVFRRQLWTKTASCWSCYCPQPFPPFGHGPEVGQRCVNEWHQEFWRGLAYVVWYTKALREAVFDFLHVQIPPNVTLDDYKKWVTDAPEGALSSQPNFAVIAYAYFSLLESSNLPDSQDIVFSLEDD